ncbi:TetR/AcrR family transcriptional regulator [Microbacterium sp. ANT_H45B]|uniref:TetR/AcrR family transcriptional regulator n=1 Tax=Microbacterium TaxID=33882 RepID=UPI0006FEEC91|nr:MULTISPECIES: TetR/AcrR family transcriptional regulator [Microbacterium]KAA0962754.1 TetR/AcrR family transcriptional regulator [Microbacterium sp. ANT_H45B]KQZ22576.1 transcriptional regulator [Microbacterium sp. Root553]MCP1427574.1 AcrR family transcriptional regulator [Microbacterium foliorum]
MSTDERSAAARRPRGPYATGQARRQAIVDEALAVFSRTGFHGGSLREIAKRVGVTPAGLLHHFADKEELFAEVLRQRDEKVRAAAGDPAEHTLIEQAKRVVAHNRTSRGLTSLYAIISAEATDPDHPSHVDFAARYRDRAADAEQILRRGQVDGEVRDDIDPARAARLISAVMDGIQLQWLLDDSVDMVLLFEEFVAGYLTPAAAPTG